LCRTRILAAVRVQCCAMNHLKLSLIMVSLSVGLSAARADSVPVEGTRELRINSGVTFLPSYGNGLSLISPENGSDETVVSMGGGLGYFLTEHVEVGGAIGYYYVKSSGASSAVKGPGFDLFLRLYSKVGNIGLFVEPTLEFQYLGLPGGSEKVLGLGADVGLEIFLVDSWALRFSPTFRYYKLYMSGDGGGSGETSGTKFGLTWGISAYF
jgi:hypothetical protein